MEQRSLQESEVAAVRARIEGEAAFKVSLLLRRELGLSQCDAEAEFRAGCLSVRLRDALTPMARLIARTEGGGQIVQGAYEVLLEDCRGRLHALVTRIIGLPVGRSQIEVDAATETVYVRFALCPGLSPPTPSRPQRRMTDA